MHLDHLILHVNNAAETVRFFVDVMGFVDEGPDDPFTTLRVNADMTIQLAPWGTEGGTHLAFALDKPQFGEVFDRIRQQGIEYGDSFHSVGNMKGPGEEGGARGPGLAVYFFDPNKHLIEIRHY